jgi:hypothetical protein
MRQDIPARTTGPVLPWWRVPTMWLVISGPALVVVASFITLVLAVRGGDTVVRDPATAQVDPMTPAAQARNHAAEPRR